MTTKTFRSFMQIAMLVITLCGGLTLSAHAQTSTSTTLHGASRSIITKKIAVPTHVNKLVEGTFTRNANGTYVVTMASTTYTVEVNTKRILNKNWQTVPFADFKTGDTVRVYGPITGTTISALAVRDISVTPVVFHIMEGVVSNLKPSSFTLTVGKTIYTVHAVTPKVLDRVWHQISYTDMQDGNTLRVFGVITGLTIEAKIVRDITVPKRAVKSTHKTTTSHA